MKPAHMPIEIEGHCIRCGKCITACPAHVIRMRDQAVVEQPSTCLSCGHCANICPVDAIQSCNGQRRRFTIQSIDSSQPISALLQKKRSIRRFANKPVEHAVLDDLLKHAEFAPSATNQRLRRYIVVTNKDRIQQMEDAILNRVMRANQLSQSVLLKSFVNVVANRADQSGRLKHLNDIIADYMTGGQPIFRHAPVVVFFLAKKRTPYALEDAVIAQDYAMLRAEELGLGSCIIGMATLASGFYRAQLPVDAGYKIGSVAVFGYPELQYTRAVKYDNAAHVTWVR